MIGGCAVGVVIGIHADDVARSGFGGGNECIGAETQDCASNEATDANDYEERGDGSGLAEWIHVAQKRTNLRFKFMEFRFRTIVFRDQDSGSGENEKINDGLGLCWKLQV